MVSSRRWACALECCKGVMSFSMKYERDQKLYRELRDPSNICVCAPCHQMQVRPLPTEGCRAQSRPAGKMHRLPSGFIQSCFRSQVPVSRAINVDSTCPGRVHTARWTSRNGGASSQKGYGTSSADVTEPIMQASTRLTCHGALLPCGGLSDRREGVRGCKGSPISLRLHQQCMQRRSVHM